MRDLSAFKDRWTGDAIGRDGITEELRSCFPDMTKVQLREIVDEIFAVVKTALKSGKRVEVRGFGSLKPYRKPSRRSYVPSKGKVVKVDSKWVVKFTTGKEFKRELMQCLEA
jgi:nucleoid DNA-binding protein